jgi:hypothetical protein
MAAVDDALASHRWLDPEPLGVGGWSYGGIMTVWIAGTPTIQGRRSRAIRDRLPILLRDRRSGTPSTWPSSETPWDNADSIARPPDLVGCAHQDPAS